MDGNEKEHIGTINTEADRQTLGSYELPSQACRPKTPSLFHVPVLHRFFTFFFICQWKN
jgi:hypothetical protein